MAKITDLRAREILDSRGYPTVEVRIALDTGAEVFSSVPGGTSNGTHEAVEVRDADPNRMGGKGVLKVVASINEIIRPLFIGQDPIRQTAADQTLYNLDGTPNKSKLGSNALLGVSMAICKAGAASVNMPLYRYLKEKYNLVPAHRMPTPIFNLINGGQHGAGNLDFQEFHVIPTSNKTFKDSVQVGVEMHMALEQVLISKNAIHSVGVEGGFAPNLFANIDALELLVEAMKRTRYLFGQDLFLGLDVSANFIYKGGKYSIRDRETALSAKELMEYYKDLNAKYHIFSIEDPFAEDDWPAWKEFTSQISDHVVVVGDDLLTTNKERLQKAITEKSCTAILVKPNQIGTVSETVEVVKIAKDAGFQVIASHRSGETNDDFIADFAVGIGADYTKFGAPIRGERIAKYNRLLAIEEEIGGPVNVQTPVTPSPVPTTPPPVTSAPVMPTTPEPSPVVPPVTPVTTPPAPESMTPPPVVTPEAPTAPVTPPTPPSMPEPLPMPEPTAPTTPTGETTPVSPSPVMPPTPEPAPVVPPMTPETTPAVTTPSGTDPSLSALETTLSQLGAAAPETPQQPSESVPPAAPTAA